MTDQPAATHTCEGEPVPHGHIRVGVHALALQRRPQRLRLLLGNAPQRGAAADGLVALTRLGGAQLQVAGRQAAAGG